MTLAPFIVRSDRFRFDILRLEIDDEGRMLYVDHASTESIEVAMELTRLLNEQAAAA